MKSKSESLWTSRRYAPDQAAPSMVLAPARAELNVLFDDDFAAVRARWSEMESKRIHEQIHTRPIVCRKRDAQRVRGERASHGYLLRFQLNPMFFGARDDRVAQLVVGGCRSQSDSEGVLHREVLHVALQLIVGQIASSELPTNEDGQRKQDQSEDDCGIPHVFSLVYRGRVYDSARVCFSNHVVRVVGVGLERVRRAVRSSCGPQSLSRRSKPSRQPFPSMRRGLPTTRTYKKR